jgi:predicted nucleotidyltransferase
MENIIIQAIVGSHAYGLNTPESDEDRLGVFVVPTEEILSIKRPKETISRTNPDTVHHEVGKYIRLALKANPTILELLFLPEYEILTEDGKLLVDNRDLFLSNTVRKSFGGYAYHQAKRLVERGDSFSSETRNRYEKHARHCFRLLRQGKQLLHTGSMNVKVENPDEYFAVGKLGPDEIFAKFKDELTGFDEVDSVLPDKPKQETINDLLLDIRRRNYG